MTSSELRPRFADKRLDLATEGILAEIDTEIRKLEQVRAILTGTDGRPGTKPQVPVRKDRRLSPEARENRRRPKGTVGEDQEGEQVERRGWPLSASLRRRDPAEDSRQVRFRRPVLTLIRGRIRI